LVEGGEQGVVERDGIEATGPLVSGGFGEFRDGGEGDFGFREIGEFDRFFKPIDEW